MEMQHEEKSIDPRFRMGDESNDPVFSQSRTTPIHKVKDIRAEGGMVAIYGLVGDKETKTLVTRREAVLRARALNEMTARMTYTSDIRENQEMVEMFIKAIDQAKRNDGGKYTATSVSMAMSSMDPSSPLFVGSKKVADAHGGPKIILKG